MTNVIGTETKSRVGGRDDARSDPVVSYVVDTDLFVYRPAFDGALPRHDGWYVTAISDAAAYVDDVRRKVAPVGADVADRRHVGAALRTEFCTTRRSTSSSDGCTVS